MKKLKLQIENLEVESFETSEAGEEHRGTVLGAARPRTQGPQVCQFATENVTGSCCDITLAPSCIQTNCLAECNSLDLNVCLA